jgi:hypothetical protein
MIAKKEEIQTDHKHSHPEPSLISYQLNHWWNTAGDCYDTCQLHQKFLWESELVFENRLGNTPEGGNFQLVESTVDWEDVVQER